MGLQGEGGAVLEGKSRIARGGPEEVNKYLGIYYTSTSCAPYRDYYIVRILGHGEYSVVVMCCLT